MRYAAGQLTERRAAPAADDHGGHARAPQHAYQDLGPDYERQATIRRQIAHHVGKLAARGFEVTLARISILDSVGSASNAA